MVDPVQLLSDVLGSVLLLMLAPGAYAIIYLEAWEPDGEGAKFGFDRRVFWLLVLGGLVGSLANIPFFTWKGSVMAINVGGALIPIALSLVLLVTLYLPAKIPDLLTLLGVFAGAVMILVVLVIRTADDVSPLELVAVLAVFGGLLVAVTRSEGHLSAPGRMKMVLGTYGLLAVGAGVTYLTSEAVPNAGIESSFPLLFVAPVLVGIGAVALRWPVHDAPGLAYAAGTIGVLVGADVLHQPLLYATPFLGAIGGAGILDLVYLSGPIALITALGLTRVLARSQGQVSPAPVPPSPGGLEGAYAALTAGRFPEVAPRAVEAVEARAAETRSSLGLPVAPAGTALLGLPLNPLVQGDYLNLQAVARRTDVSRDEAHRALRAGFYLQRALDEVFVRRLGTLRDRTMAFLLDLLVTLSPGCVVLALIVTLGGVANVVAVVDSIPYEAVLLAFGAYPFVVWVLTETLTGTTPGKWVLHLQVVDAQMRRPSLLATLSRNSTKLVVLTVLSVLIGVAIPIAASPSVEGLGLGGVLGALILVGGALVFLGVSGLCAAAIMASNPRRQRLGDLMAGTRVVRSRGPPAALGAAPVPPWAASPAGLSRPAPPPWTT